MNRFASRPIIQFGSVALLLGAVVNARSADPIQNPPSAFEVIVDGLFTDGLTSQGALQGEWSDVTPAAFISPPTPGGTLLSVPLGTPGVNSLLYGGLAPGVAQEEGVGLYLMYDYLPRTDQNFNPGDVVAKISFPITTGQTTHDNASVIFQAGAITPSTTSPEAVTSFFDVFVDLDGTGKNLLPAEEFGIEGAVGFGPSTLSLQDHLQVELEVPLDIPPEFGNPEGPLPPVGQKGAYSPDPKFWGSDILNDSQDPPASAAIFQILPDGTTIVIPRDLPPPTVPESLPLWYGVLAIGSVLLLARSKPSLGIPRS